MNKLFTFVSIVLFMLWSPVLYSLTLSGGTYTVGTGGNYANLTAVAAELNSKTITGDVIFEFTSAYNGSAGETFPITFNQFATSGGTWTATIRPAAGVSDVTTEGDPGSANSLIVLNGTDRIRLDGRPGGVTTTPSWVLRNTRSTASIGPVITFINDACNNIILYVQVEGQNTVSNIGLIKFGTTTGTTGNDNNLISNCNIYSIGYGAVAKTGIYSLGTVEKENDNISIVQNNIGNMSVYGINITSTGNGNSWMIIGNSIFYNRFTVDYATETQTAIYFMPGSTSSGNYINDNFIGGDQRLGMGWWSCNNISFVGIKAAVGTGTLTHINNNIFGTVMINTTGPAYNYSGIQVTQGTCEILNNLIGGIDHQTTIDGNGTFWGISSNGTNTVSGNEISFIARKTSNSPTFICIYLAGANNQTASRNKITHISQNSDALSLGALVTGIQVIGAPASTPTISLINNQIILGDLYYPEKTIYTGIDGYAYAGNNIQSLYNSILISGSINEETSGGNAIPTSYCYRMRGNQNEIHRNNIYCNKRTGEIAENYSIFVENADAIGTFSSDYNLLIANKYVGFWLAKRDFTTWKSVTGGDANSWAVAFGSSQAPRIFTDDQYDLHLYGGQAGYWLAHGKGIPLSSISTDIDGESRHNIVTQGPTDLGCDDNCSPVFGTFPTLTADHAPALGTTTTYTFGGKTVAAITWGSSGTVPTSLSFMYFTGVLPPGSISGNHAYGYWELNPTGGSGYTYSLTLYFGDNILYKIGNKANIKIANNPLFTTTWSILPASSVNITANSVTMTGLTSLTKFTLSDQLDPLAYLYVYLQGSYNAETYSMNTSLNSSGLIPLSQPYNTVPWSYAGTESVASIPADVVDWILVELRTGTGPETKVATRAGFLKTDGNISDLDGTNLLAFPGLSGGNYYVVIRHRNHLPVMSSTPIAINSSSSGWGLTNQSAVYGTNALIDLGSGNFGMIAGDATGDGQVNVEDRNATWNNKNLTGYRLDDVSLDGQVNVEDRNITWNNKNLSTQIP